MPDVFKILKDLELKAVGLDPETNKMQEGVLLEIRANWTSVDVANASEATDFGPFTVSTKTVDVGMSLTHPGPQVIGWLLQPMPALPPNDATSG